MAGYREDGRMVGWERGRMAGYREDGRMVGYGRIHRGIEGWQVWKDGRIQGWLYMGEWPDMGGWKY